MTIPTGPMEGLEYLLQRWTTESECCTTDQGAALAHGVWRRLAEALCGNEPARMAPFSEEMAELWRSGKNGYPPVQALQVRLRELVEGGLQELFIVAAVRQGLDQLIADHIPSAFDCWRELSDELMLAWVQFSYRDCDLPPNHITYTVDKG
ncbi:MAG: hypothetical protein M3Z66_17910 [Chloroflexota bacterium]|nr:hypothetical protein [Chloroflexota bacterium]